jgi:acyl-CoA thioesterase
MPVMSTNDGEKEEGVEVQAEFTRALGIEILGMVDGESVLEVELGPIHMSRANRAHGGLLFTLLDTALGRAVLDALPAGRGCATVELKINYFRPVQSGRVRAVGRLLELTKSLGYAEGEVMNDAGKVLARASGTFFLTRTMRQDERERI